MGIVSVKLQNESENVNVKLSARFIDIRHSQATLTIDKEFTRDDHFTI